MGLNTDYGCYDGSYSGFSTFRVKIARAIGEPIGVNELGEFPLLWNREWPEGSSYGKWPKGEPEDPIYVLLNHSDCDGYIAKRHLVPLAERLEAIADVQGQATCEWDDFPAKLRKFANGLRKAHRDGKKVSFH